MMKDIGVKPNLNLNWRDRRYKRYYEVIDFLVNRIQEHVWLDSGKAKRRLRGSDLEKLHYSVECLVRDCIAVVLQKTYIWRKRLSKPLMNAVSPA